MKLHLQEEIQNFGTAPPIYYKIDVTVNKKTESRSDSIELNIKTHPGEKGIETISLYVLVFNQGLP